MTTYYPDREPLLQQNWYYETLFRFYIKNAVSVLVPFIALLIMNTFIVFRLKRQLHTAKLFLAGVAGRKKVGIVERIQ